MIASKTVTSANKCIATLLAFLIVPLSGLVTDIYLPSMPHMAEDLGLAESKIQLTISCFLISYGLTQFIAGSVVDAFGRYKITMASLLLFAGSSFVIATSDSIIVILAMRIVQGICAGFAIVSKRVFFIDVYEGEKQKSLLSTMTIVWAAAPIIAPFVGGYLENYFGWRSNFYLLTAYGLIMFLLEFLFSGETIQQYHDLNLKATLTKYKEMFQAADFTLGVALTGISYGLVMMYSMSGPFIIEHEMHYSPVITGYISLLLGIGWMCGGFLSKAIIKIKVSRKSPTAIIIQGLTASVMMVTAYWYGQSLYSLSATAFIIHAAAGFTFNIFFTHALARFPQYAGIANGITGGGTFFITSFLSYSAIALFNPFSQSQLGMGYLAFAALALTALFCWLASLKHG